MAIYWGSWPSHNSPNRITYRLILTQSSLTPQVLFLRSPSLAICSFFLRRARAFFSTPSGPLFRVFFSSGARVFFGGSYPSYPLYSHPGLLKPQFADQYVSRATTASTIGKLMDDFFLEGIFHSFLHIVYLAAKYLFYLQLLSQYL